MRKTQKLYKMPQLSVKLFDDESFMVSYDERVSKENSSFMSCIHFYSEHCSGEVWKHFFDFEIKNGFKKRTCKKM